MRIYDYKCRDCNNVFEITQNNEIDDFWIICPKCKGFNCVRMFSEFKFYFNKDLKALDKKGDYGE